MQGKPASAAEVELARSIRRKAIEIGTLLGLPDGTPWVLELQYGPEGYLRLRRHHGPVGTEDDLLALARTVGVYRDSSD